MTQKGIKRKALSLKEKLRVIREVESNPTLTPSGSGKVAEHARNYSQRNYGEKGF
jgi:hypothetical protein